MSLVVSGEQYTQVESGLIIPVRAGDRIEIAIPQGSYSLAAFASPRDSLFTTPDPFSATTGAWLEFGGRDALDLSLAARTPMPVVQPACTCQQCRYTTAQPGSFGYAYPPQLGYPPTPGYAPQPAPAAPQYWMDQPGYALQPAPAAAQDPWASFPGCTCAQCQQFRNGY